MSETLLLLIIAVCVLLVVRSLRWVIADRKITPLSKRMEALVRVGLALLGGLIAHAWYYDANGLRFWLAVASNALILYACTHLAERVLLREA